MKIENIKIENYTYNLPDKRIAKYPLQKRHQSKLLIYKDATIKENAFNTLPKYLSDKHLLVFNNSKVIQARLVFKKDTGANIEVFCLEPITPPNYEQIFQSKNTCVWRCTVGNLKKWKGNVLSKEFTYNSQKHTLCATLLKKESDDIWVQFEWCGEITFADILKTLGAMPIPPYLNRASENIDKERYQTVYSKVKGSVAAPTAGLHFSSEVLERLKKKGIKMTEISLHVGAGTFKPVLETYISNHKMHTEQVSVSTSALRQIIINLNNIVAVGTTSIRTIESLYWLGLKVLQGENNLNLGQWEAYNLNSSITAQQSLKALLNYMKHKDIEQLNFHTKLMIVPTYNFKIVSGLITNFHQPQSTLLLLIATFVGSAWQKIYNYALKNNFRFLSYGDSSLLWKKQM